MRGLSLLRPICSASLFGLFVAAKNTSILRAFKLWFDAIAVDMASRVMDGAAVTA